MVGHSVRNGPRTTPFVRKGCSETKTRQWNIPPKNPEPLSMSMSHSRGQGLASWRWTVAQRVLLRAIERNTDIGVLHCTLVSPGWSPALRRVTCRFCFHYSTRGIRMTSLIVNSQWIVRDSRFYTYDRVKVADIVLPQFLINFFTTSCRYSAIFQS